MDGHVTDIHDAKQAVYAATHEWERLLRESWQDRAAAEWNYRKDENAPDSAKYEWVAERMQAFFMDILRRETCRLSGGFSVGNMLEQRESDLARKMHRELERAYPRSPVVQWIDAAFRRQKQKAKTP